MSIKIKFSCDGCFAEADGTRRLERHTCPAFRGEFPRDGSGCFVVHEYDTVQDVAPNGWMPFDPYTGCCYCPKCWGEIEGASEERAAARAALEDKP